MSRWLVCAFISDLISNLTDGKTILRRRRRRRTEGEGEETKSEVAQAEYAKHLPDQLEPIRKSLFKSHRAWQRRNYLLLSKGNKNKYQK